MLQCCDNDTEWRNCLQNGPQSKRALISKWGISAGNKLCHLVDNTRAGILDKYLICHAAMEVFMMAIEIDSRKQRSILMCVCCLVRDNEKAGSVLLKTTQTK